MLSTSRIVGVDLTQLCDCIKSGLLSKKKEGPKKKKKKRKKERTKTIHTFISFPFVGQSIQNTFYEMEYEINFKRRDEEWEREKLRFLWVHVDTGKHTYANL